MRKLSSPVKIAGLYAIAGFLWINVSDRILKHAFPDLDRLSQFQTLKGALYVLVTAVLVYLLVRSELLKEWKLRQELRDLVEDKNALLQEIHHRVKNNLQVISSLLSLQEGVVESEECRDSLLKSDLRVRSMALVHEHLYAPGTFNRIELGSYIEDLVSMLSSSWTGEGRTVRFLIEADPVEVPLEKAVSCGLILSELVVNSLKHAFPDRSEGEIRIHVARRGELISVVVSDNGVGFRPQSLHVAKGGLGLIFIDTLIRQLSGRIVFRKEGGTTVRFHFPFSRRKRPRTGHPADRGSVVLLRPNGYNS